MSQDSFEVAIKTASGEERGVRSVGVDRLDSRVRYSLLREAVRMYRANARRGTHKAKTRSEVSGTGHKPWRQKGTGRARSGSRKSPLWRGGGVVFGPSPRDYSYAINRKQRRIAVRSALMGKVRDGQVVVLEGLELDAPKTKVLAAALRAIGVEGRCLIGTKGVDRNVYLSGRNIDRVTVLPVADFTALEVLRSQTVVLLADAAQEILGREAAGDSEDSPADTGERGDESRREDADSPPPESTGSTEPENSP